MFVCQSLSLCLTRRSRRSQAISADESVIEVPEPDVFEPKAEHNQSQSQMIWCEPPERLESVLKFESSIKRSHLPLISIAQFNTNETNWTPDSTTTTTATTSTTSTTSTTQQPNDSIITSTLLSLTINVTKLYELLSNESSSETTNPTTEETTTSSAKVNHPHGTEIVFRCLPASDGGKNTWTITCEDGGWIGRASKCGI